MGARDRLRAVAWRRIDAASCRPETLAAARKWLDAAPSGPTVNPKARAGGPPLRPSSA